jgi:predicted DNA-binding protein
MSDDEWVHPADAAVVAAIHGGTVRWEPADPQQEADLLASLPAEMTGGIEDTVVVTSVRLPYPLHQRLRAYAAEHGTTVSVLLRQWIEFNLDTDDRPVSMRDVIRAVASLPRTA